MDPSTSDQHAHSAVCSQDLHTQPLPILLDTSVSTETPHHEPCKDFRHTGVINCEAGSTSTASHSVIQASTDSSTAGSPCFHSVNYFDNSQASTDSSTAGSPCKDSVNCIDNFQFSNQHVCTNVLSQFSHMIHDFWPSPAPDAQCEFPEFMSQFLAIKATGLPNYLGAKIPVASALNLHQWDSALEFYHDNQICSFLKYGWPIGYLHSRPPVAVPINHKSALEFPDHVSKFIATELEFDALVGPFSVLPFQPWTRLSPLMTRPKKNSQDRRVIVDLSFPPGLDVNSGIDITNLLGHDVSYTLPSISDLVAKLQLEGKGSFIWKADLSRAYRQFRIDPLDAPLMGIHFNGSYYIDRCPAFGCRSSSAVCQRVANALVYILAQAGVSVLAYLDDFAACSFEYANALESYHHFLRISDSLGLQLAKDKCVKPSTSAEWLGYEIDTIAMSVSIPQNKILEVIHECQLWAHKRRASKHMIQSLLGKLVHVSNCIPQARKFITRILATLRAMGNKDWVSISQEFLKDVQWFSCYAKSSNGILLYTPVHDVYEFECDSSLAAGGGCFGSAGYIWPYPQHHKDRFQSIHELEAVNLLVCCKTFAHVLPSSNALIIIYTDNMASSYALESGRTRDPTLAACARELWLLAASNSHNISIKHKRGSQLQLADALSRTTIDPSKAAFVHHLTSSQQLTLVQPVLHNYQFFNQFI